MSLFCCCSISIESLKLIYYFWWAFWWSIDQQQKIDPPEVSIALGSNINGGDVKEGDDLYIECHIRANPSFHKLQWTHNVSWPVSQIRWVTPAV